MRAKKVDANQKKIMKHKLEQEVLDDYIQKFETYLRVCHLIEKIDPEIYQLALKKAAGCKMMMDYLSKTNILPTC